MTQTAIDRKTILSATWQFPPNTVTDLPIVAIVAGDNDRTVFDDAGLTELAESIRVNGLAQPITVRWLEKRDCFQIVAGERRFRAHKLLGKPTVRALIADMTDEEASAVMLAENTGRKDLDPVDEAQAYQSRMTRYGWDAKTVAEKAGVSVQRVNNRLKLLALRDDLLHLVRTNNLQLGYAQIIAEADLDRNRQLMAIRKLQENPSPTPAWLRKVCSELLEQQAQGDMFDSPLFGGADFAAVQTVQKVEWKAPADPRKDKAPTVGQSHRELVQNQIDFWFKAADAWDRYGKSAPRDRCLSAAKALQDVLQFMPKGKARRLTQNNQTFVVYAQ